MIPERPATFAPDKAPDFVELKLAAYKNASGGVWWADRPIIKPRLQLVHTNGASKEGTIESAINWGNKDPGANTHPHYQVDRGRAAKLVPTNRKGIGNATAATAQGQYGNVSNWSIVIETADEGWPTPGNNGGFIGNQIEMIAQILAYESIVHGIPLARPMEWHGAGSATHTDPFGYPYWTIAVGKPCPGATKKKQFWADVLPRAIEIATAWTTPEETVDYFIMKPLPAPVWQTIAPFTAVRIDPYTWAKRGLTVSNLRVMPAEEADKYQFLVGMTNEVVE